MIEPNIGILLIAEPFLKDPSFMRSVVLLCRHIPEEGSLGFTLNKLYELKLDDLVPALSDFDWPVYLGGPVQMDTLHYLHQYPELLPDSQRIAENVYWGGDFEALKSLMQLGKIEPDKIKFYLGYSGWTAGQLDLEMEENSWLTVHSTPKIIFETNTDQIWKKSLYELGGKYTIMANFPTDPQLN